MAFTSLLADNSAMRTIRARLAFHTRQHGFDRAARQLASGADIADTERLAAQLFAHWGDPLQPADERFLRSVLAEARAADGAILQCGSTLSTLILGVICDQHEQPKKRLWSLEADPHWANIMRSWLTEYQINSAHVIHSPPRLFKNYVWYSLDPERLAKAYHLVVCDGNRASVKGGVATVHRISDRLAKRFVILIRNLGSAADMKALAAWAKTRDATCVLIDKAEGFVKIASRAVTPPLPETRSGAQALRNSTTV
jgi:hypothetical protein